MKNHAISILTSHHNLSMCHAKQYHNYEVPASPQSHVPLYGPFCLLGTAQPPFCLQPPPQDRQCCLQNISRIRKMMSLGEDHAPLSLLLEILPFPQESARAETNHSCVAFVGPRNVLSTWVMLQISVPEKKRGRPSAPGEPATSAMGQIFPGSAHDPPPRRSSH